MIKNLLFITSLIFLIKSEIPDLCKNIVLGDHLQLIQSLIDNQLQKGCLIKYISVINQNMTEGCFVKAALPWIIELLEHDFQYKVGSENWRRIRVIKEIVSELYLKKCVTEDDIGDFQYMLASCEGDPQDALSYVQHVLHSYKIEVQKANSSLNWGC